MTPVEEAVVKIVEEHHGAWGSIRLQLDWLREEVATAVRKSGGTVEPPTDEFQKWAWFGKR